MSEITGLLYQDSRGGVTYATFDNEGMSYPIGKIASVTKPRKQPFKPSVKPWLVLALGFMAIFAMVMQWGFLGMALFLIMGLLAVTGIFDFWRGFNPTWLVTVTLINGEEVRVLRVKKKEIKGLYKALRKALEE